MTSATASRSSGKEAVQNRSSSRGVPRIVAVDIFCGLGGLTHGLVRGGVKVVAGVDVDPECRFAYEKNNRARFVERSVRDLTGEDVQKLYGRASIRLLAGCAPCQPFSTYSRKGRRERKDDMWDLLNDFARIANGVEPELITMENVPQLADHPVFTEFAASLKGYHTWSGIVECARYGVPQTRRRLVFLASRLGSVSLLASESVQAQGATVRESIGHLPRLGAGEACADDPLHAASALSDLNIKRIRASKPGGTWRDWPESLLAECHRRGTGQTYPSVYGRMEWDAPAPTITTQCFGYGNGRFGHPEQDRAISLREAAILQTFPDDYRFVSEDRPIRFATLGRLIGNAVPVRLGEIVARSLYAHVAEHSGVRNSRGLR